MRRLGTLLLAIGAVISAMPAIGHAQSLLTRHLRKKRCAMGKRGLADASPQPKPCSW